MTLNERQRIEIAVRRALADGRREDSGLEFKETLPEKYSRAARQIAALANAARGPEVFWLIGVNDDGEVVGCSNSEVSSWWAQVQRYFDEVSPGLTDLSLSHHGKNVLALRFSTDRAPYVCSAEGRSELEVPWRDGTRTRSAHRRELLRILADNVPVPEIEIIDAVLSISFESAGGEVGGDLDSRVQFDMATFVDTRQGVAFPAHRQRLAASFRNLGEGGRFPLKVTWQVEGVDYGVTSSRRARQYGAGTAHVSRPSAVSIRAWWEGELPPEQLTLIGSEQVVSVSIAIYPSGSPSGYFAEIELRGDNSSDGKLSTLRWHYDPMR